MTIETSLNINIIKDTYNVPTNSHNLDETNTLKPIHKFVLATQPLSVP